MRILSWNINGIRTLPQYHPWNTLPVFDDILDALEADVLCFQEVKSTRQGLLKDAAVPPSYHAFFSFPLRKSGYSGVGTYVRKTVATPVKAEEGLCSILQPKPPLDASEKVSKSAAYPQAVIENEEDDDVGSDAELDFKDLDSEGRTLVLDFGLFVLINVYCPNDGNGTEERDKYKMDFHRILEARVKGLVEVEGREVIVVGDLNACAAVIDHCEGQLMVAKGLTEGLQGEEGFWGKDVRRWLKSWMVADDGSGGPMIDITRRLWPDRKGMYTCWNTKISARETNYGTRIDYILITRGLLPWVKSADIQPHIKGSDHCPVYVDLHDEMTDANGAVVKLRDAMGYGSNQPQEPPRIASKFWNEYSGKQKLLQHFFTKAAVPSPANSDTLEISGVKAPELPSGGDATACESFPRLSGHEDKTQEPATSSILRPSLATKNDPPISAPTLTPTPSSSSTITTLSLEAKDATSPTKTKRKLTVETSRSAPPKRTKSKTDREREKSDPGQATLSSFFAKPKANLPSRSDEEIQKSISPTTTNNKPSQKEVPVDVDMFDDLGIAEVDPDVDGLLSSSQITAESSLSRTTPDAAETKQAWSSLLAPIQPPKCTVHGEPAKELTVNKPGANKGKRFFICSRPVGPGYDKGREKILREHVDPQWKCDFFRWSSDVRREMRKKEPP